MHLFLSVCLLSKWELSDAPGMKSTRLSFCSGPTAVNSKSLFVAAAAAAAAVAAFPRGFYILYFCFLLLIFIPSLPPPS